MACIIHSSDQGITVPHLSQIHCYSKVFSVDSSLVSPSSDKLWYMVGVAMHLPCIP